MAEKIDVYMFSLPAVTEGESILGPPCQTKQFDSLESARQFAEQSKDTYHRITINVASAEKPILLERFDDGKRIVIEQKRGEADSAELPDHESHSEGDATSTQPDREDRTATAKE